MMSVVRGWAAIAAVGSLSLAIAACAVDETGSNASAVHCMPGQPQLCSCVGGASGMQVCGMDGASFATPCMCAPGTPSAGAGGGSGAAGAANGSVGAGAAGSAAGAGGFTATAGASGAGLAGMSGQGGAGGMAVTGGSSGSSGAGAMGGAGAGGAQMTAGSGGAAASDDEFTAERQACVDEINMYRMSIGRMPLVRGTPEQETCSDMGAKQDADSGDAHSSAGTCSGLGAQNTCPGYALNFGGGTLEGTLKFCLMPMWEEGEPAEGVQACIADRTGCFLDHGHWINMQSTTAGRVACGFYKMADGRYWMNQNFGR